MEIREFLALVLVSCVVASGISFPLFRYRSKILFLGAGLLFVILYSVLISKTVDISSVWTSDIKQPFIITNLLTYLINGLIAGVYLLITVFCSGMYDSLRTQYKISGKDFFFSRWLGILIGGILLLLLYLFNLLSWHDIFLSTFVNIFAIFVVLIVIFIPIVITHFAKKENKTSQSN